MNETYQHWRIGKYRYQYVTNVHVWVSGELYFIDKSGTNKIFHFLFMKIYLFEEWQPFTNFYFAIL